MISVKCVKCGKVTEVADDRAGQDEACPGCGNVNIVPSSEVRPDAAAGAPGAETKPMSEKDARLWAMLCHLAGFAGCVLPYAGNIVGPLVVWLIQKDKSPFIDQHGKEALNFQISMSIYGAVAMVLTFIFIGFLLLPAIAITAIVLVIIAALKANQGKDYRYPLSIRFIK